MQHSGAEPEGSSHDLTPLRTREATSAATGKRKGGQEANNLLRTLSLRGDDRARIR